MSISPKDLPRFLRGPYVIGAAAAGLLVAAGTALAVVRVEAGRVVDQKWDEALQAKVTQIATSAAVAASREAVERITREQVAPLKETIDRHVPLDDDRVAELRSAVASCCQITPRWSSPTTSRETPRTTR